jgi:transcriptional regulator GlxA family with amidase domain
MGAAVAPAPAATARTGGQHLAARMVGAEKKRVEDSQGTVVAWHQGVESAEETVRLHIDGR